MHSRFTTYVEHILQQAYVPFCVRNHKLLLPFIRIHCNPTQAFRNKGGDDPSESVQQQPINESNHSPEKVPDTQVVNMKGAPSCKECGRIFLWDQLQLKWPHKCTESAESDRHVANATSLVATSEVPLVAKPKALTDTTPNVSTVATHKEPTVTTPEAHVTDSSVKQRQLDIRVCMYVYMQSIFACYIYGSV